MADGGVFELVNGVLGPLNEVLDYLFYAGVLYGAKNVARLVIRACSGFRTYFIPFGRASNRDLGGRYGEWAVITGGTSGIGLAYAHEFAKRKMNVVLISRSYDDLVNIISDLQTKYSVQTYGIYADFSLGGKVYQDVEDTLKDLDVGILVNDVAIRYDHPQYFALVPHQRMWQMMDANVTAITVMTHLLLPQMLERERGAIINVCSVAASTPPIPLTAEYTASMAYVDSFSRTLYYENRHKGISVQTLLPCFVAQPGMSPTIFTPSPETYVRHAIATLGIKSRVCGYWPHALQSWLCCLIPERIWVWIMMYFNTATRRRCLAEKEASGAPKFSRKVYDNTASHLARGGGGGGDGKYGMHGGRRSADLGLRRTTSPQDYYRFNMDTNTGTRSPVSWSPVPTHRGMNQGRNSMSTDKKLTLDKIGHTRSSSAGSTSMIPTPPINEGSAVPFPCDLGGLYSPRLERTAASSVPRKSLTTSSLETPVGRLPVSKRTSRVLVMPSVARITYSPEHVDYQHYSHHHK